jgi:hypothetical protein
VLAYSFGEQSTIVSFAKLGCAVECWLPISSGETAVKQNVFRALEEARLGE